ncbi:MAG TPA: flagellar motor protein MotB [Nocardioidaceae bacterium]|nr:flagellar motor protein MotB [Nocardioidaceae bacterium]
MATHSRRRRAPEEEHENSERWLVTYADMITLLMVLFIVMFAISQVDQKRFNALKDGLAAGFGQPVSVLNGSTDVMEQPGLSPIPPVAPADFSNQPSPPASDAQQVSDQVDRAEQLRNQRRYAEAAAEAARLDAVRKRLLAALRRRGLAGDVRMVVDDRGLTVSLVSKHIVFEPNLAQLTSRGVLVLRTLAPVLRDVPDDLQIDGHTNQVPVRPKYYATDWELSAARAVTVLRHLHEHGGIPERRLSAVAYGEERPLIDPDRPGSQRINKRVDIVVLSALSDETRGLLAQAARDRTSATTEVNR